MIGIPLAFAALLSVLLLPASPLPSPPPPALPRLALIGLDAADWGVIDPQIAAGRMPVLKRLIENGSSGTLASLQPSISPSLWTTIITGKSRHEHGIEGFVVADANGQPVPVTANFRKVKALWNIASEKGLSVGFINWWPSYPAENVNGYIVSNYLRYLYPQYFAQGEEFQAQTGAFKSIAFPEELEEMVKELPSREPEFLKGLRNFDPRLLEKHGVKPVADPTFRVKLANVARVLNHAVAEDELATSMARRLLKEKPVDLFGIYLEGIDVLSHLLWPYYRAGEFSVGTEAARDLGGIIPAYYEHVDRLVGGMIEGFRPGTDIVIVSDHGYGTETGGKHTHRPEGIIILSGPSFRKGGRIAGASLYDVAPTLLYLLGLPIARDLPGKALLDAFTDDFRAAHPPAWVDSYETPGEKPAPREAIVTPLDEATREKLRTLGYIK